MEIECSQAGHCPHDLGQHAEGHYHLQVGLVGAQFLKEGLILEFFGLKHGNSMSQRILLHRTLLQHVVMTANRFVGHSNDGNDVIVALNQAAQGLDGEIGRSHVYDSNPTGGFLCAFVHIFIIIYC